MPTPEFDSRVRLAAFDFLAEQSRLHGDVLPREMLATGFILDGQRVPLLGPQGIFKPAIVDLPLSFTTVPTVEGRDRPYDDHKGPDGLVRYRYRGDDPNHRDNSGLREAMRRRLPLVHFAGIVPGQYMALWPVFIVHDDQASLTFTAAVEGQQAGLVTSSADPTDPAVQARRSYVTTLVLKRVHQASFRQRVLRAYSESCSICRLKHVELLEAAHILPDGHPRGEPVVANGVALCKLHHAAFDRHILGITPDLDVRLRHDILEEVDGPMLEHGLRGFEGARIKVPRAAELQPNKDFLAERYDLFRRAS